VPLTNTGFSIAGSQDGKHIYVGGTDFNMGAQKPIVYGRDPLTRSLGYVTEHTNVEEGITSLGNQDPTRPIVVSPDDKNVQLVINGALDLGNASAADINDDGKTDAVDVQLVINAALGLS